MSPSNLRALAPCVALLAASALLCLPLTAADVEHEAELKLAEGGKDFTNSVGMKLVRIKKGKFRMGSPNDDPDAQQNERPRHQVELTKDFYLGVYEVTQKQYRAVMGTNPSHFSKTGGGAGQVNNLDTDDFPVEQASWDDAQAFMKKLNELAAEKNAGRKYRLPTEAEWEYACRAGTDVKEPFTLAKPVAKLNPRQANYRDSNLNRTCRVGSYEANPFGLFDMHGNVTEWCHDWWDDTIYRNNDRKDPTGPKASNCRILRGGSWADPAFICRSGCRHYSRVTERVNCYGFRAACDLQRD